MPNGDAGNAGQVLTSNGAGAAPAWRTPVTNGGGRFWMRIASNINSASGASQGRGGWNTATGGVQSDSMDFDTPVTSGNDFTINSNGITNNFIKVNRAGLYHFEGGVRYFVNCDASLTLLPIAQLSILFSHPSISFQSFDITEEKMDKVTGAETASSQNIYIRFVKFSIDLYLPAGANVIFKHSMFNLRFPLAIMGIQSGGYLSGHFIAE
jgi:hypothetical protein